MVQYVRDDSYFIFSILFLDYNRPQLWIWVSQVVYSMCIALMYKECHPGSPQPSLHAGKKLSDCEPETEWEEGGKKQKNKRVNQNKLGLFMAASSVPVWEVGGHPRAGSDRRAGGGGGGVGAGWQTLFTTNPGGRPRRRAQHPSAVTWSPPAASETGEHTSDTPARQGWAHTHITQSEESWAIIHFNGYFDIIVVWHVVFLSINESITTLTRKFSWEILSYIILCCQSLVPLIFYRKFFLLTVAFVACFLPV